MARWEIKNVAMRGVSMAVPSRVVKTADFDFFTPQEAEVFDNTVGIKRRHIAPMTFAPPTFAMRLPSVCWPSWVGNGTASMS